MRLRFHARLIRSVPRASERLSAAESRAAPPLLARRLHCVRFLTLACACLGVLPQSALARIYSCEDGSGRVTLRDAPCKRGEIDLEPEPQAPAAEHVQPARAVPAAPAKISETQVRELANALSVAYTRRDVRAIMGYFSADAVFEVEYRLADGSQLQRFSKEQYAAYLRDTFRLDAEWQREEGDIVLSPGEEHAEIISATTGPVLVRGQTLNGVTRSRASVEMRDGRAQVTLLRAVATLMEEGSKNAR